VLVESAGVTSSDSGVLLEESPPQALKNESAAAERKMLVLVLKFILTSFLFALYKIKSVRGKKKGFLCNLRLRK
jgi:hypothetical protein